MFNMKKAFILLLVSVLGGTLTLGAYKLFIEKPEIKYVQEKQNELKSTAANFVNTPINYAAERTDFTVAAEKTLDAVVHVKNKSVYTPQMTIQDLIYGRAQGHQRIQIGTGSGVIISPDGYIITNNHVINGANELEIVLNNKKTYKAELIGTDATNDIALVKIDANDLPYVTFGDSDHLKVGEWVLAVGNPFNLTSTVTAGIISAKGRDLANNNNKIESYIQTDAVVNPGNSGGALVNNRGELIGINTMITSTTGSYIGYSFAVPSNIAKKVVDDILEYGNVQRAFIGINYKELNGENYLDYNVNEPEGVIVTNVLSDSGAEKAGLKIDDVIVKANDIKIATFADLNGFLNTKRPDDVVDFTIIRNGNEKVIPVKLYKNISTTVNRLGLNLEDLKPSELKKFNLKRGVKIKDIFNEELKSIGLKKGQVILSINGEKINNVEDVNTIMNLVNINRKLLLEVLTQDGVTERYIFN